MKKIYYSIYALIVTFTVILLAYIFVFDKKESSEHYFPISGVTTWTDYSLEVNGNQAILKGTIPINSGNTLAFFSIHTNVTVYCNNELIYQYPVKNTNPFAKTPGYSWNFVNLPYSNNEIEIHFTAAYSGYADSTPYYFLGDSVSILGQIMQTNFIPYLVCILIFFFGVCMILYWFFIRTQIHLNPRLLFLGIFAVFLSIWSGNESYLTKLIFKNNITTSYISFVMLMLCPLPFAQFTRYYYQDDHKIWDIFCIFNLIQIITCVFLQYFKILDFRHTLWTTHTSMFLLVFIVVFRSICRIRSGNNTAEIKTHLICIILCTFCVSIDLFLYYTNVRDNNVFGRIGFFAYIIILGITSIKESTDLMKLGREATTYMHLAYTDQMTGVFNRTAYNNDFEEHLSNPDDVCIINFDLNNLKKINDSMGHAFGDNYIINAAHIISDSFSAIAKCYRVGGDEFVVIMKNASRINIQQYLNSLEDRIKDFNKSQDNFDLQIAYGYAHFDSKSDCSLSDTCSRADRYMYQNKTKKKNKS